MSDINKINEEALDNVVGGKRMIVENPNVDYVNVRRGPGTFYGVAFTLDNGTVVNVVAKKYSEEDGYNWSQLDSGYWVASHLLGNIYG